MPDQSSPRLALPYLMPSQAQKHVTHNEALQQLDALVQLTVQGFGAETPPAAPAPGETHALGDLPQGAWAGRAQQLAIWQGEGWLFLAPQPGWRAWDAAAATLRTWDGTAWAAPQQLGINTPADAQNRLALRAEAALFTHDGQGHQVKINKSGAAETAALLLQSDWSGRAELGLLGSDDFTIKLSADGAAWQEALVLAANGRAGFGTASPAALLEIAGSGADYLLAGDGSADFRLAADGNGSCSGAWSGGGADYAEWFEWADSNPADQDRRGISVVLEGDKIRAAGPGEEPIGAVSAAPAVIGGDDSTGWQGRWLRDEFASLRRDAEGRPLENPAYDPARAHVPRAERPEWALIGLLGRLRIRTGQPAGARWQHMRQVSDGVEEWLLR